MVVIVVAPCGRGIRRADSRTNCLPEGWIRIISSMSTSPGADTKSNPTWTPGRNTTLLSGRTVTEIDATIGTRLRPARTRPSSRRGLSVVSVTGAPVENNDIQR